MKELLGHKITKVEVEEAGAYLRISTDRGGLIWYSDGDCCSTTWINDIIGVNLVLNHQVLEVDEKEVICENDPEHDCLQTYGFTIKTVNGFMDVIFRNASNGYYGGSLELVDRHRNPIVIEYVEKAKFKEVKSDWTC